MISTVFLSITFAATAAVFTITLYGSFTKQRRIIDKRMAEFKSGSESIYAELNTKNTVKKSFLDSKSRNFIKKATDTIYSELSLAGIKTKPEEFILIWLLLAFLPAGLIALITKQALPAAAFTAVGAAAPIIYLKSKKQKRIHSFESQLSDALVVCCNCLRSGLSFQQAMETIASDMPAPIGTEFSQVLNEIKFGASLEKALTDMTERIKSADLMLVVSAVLIQRGTGGNLSQILDTISETIKDRLKIKQEIKTVTAQGRMSSSVIGGLPIAIGLVLMVINPSYMMTFFVTTAGNIMLVVAIMLEIIGFAVIRKVVTVKY